MARAKQPKQIYQMTISQWEVAFPNEEACCAYLVGHRWPDGVACPRCGNVKVKETMRWNWLCNECSPSDTNYRFSHITGTIFENTNKALRDWFRVIHLMLISKKGISAMQIHRMMGFGSYRTAWYMCHRIRAALADEQFKKILSKSMNATSAARTRISFKTNAAAEVEALRRAKRQLWVPSAARAISLPASLKIFAPPL